MLERAKGMFDRRDFKQEEIDRLRQELATERLRVSELTKALVALTSRGTYREIWAEKPKEEEKKKKSPPPRLSVDPRKEVYVPRVSYAEVAERMARLEQEGKLY
jgi:hypothetical protein